MKKLVFLLFAIALLFSCKQPGAGQNPGLPSQASLSGSKGIFVQGSGTKSIRALSTNAKVLIAASGATLGQITSSNLPQSVTFLDDKGNDVLVAVSKAMQLDSAHLLMTYSCAAGSGIGILNLSSGSLISTTVVPDNWPFICTQGQAMYFESGGSIYSTDLSTGAATIISTSANTYDMNAEVGISGTLSGSAAWGSRTWIYVDGSGNIYALYSASSASNQALCIPASGSVIDFGSNYTTYSFYDSLPIGTIVWSGWVTLDSGNLYLIKDAPNPTQGTGNTASVFLVTFNPAAPGVISIASTATSSAIGTNWTGGMSMIGSGLGSMNNVWSNGPDTWKLSGGVITYYNTSAVPVSNIVPGETSPEINSVTNWQYSGGAIYSGPCATSTAVNLVQFLTAPNVSDPPLVDEAGITSWSVVGGVLFYTDATGTHQGLIDTSDGTLGAVTAYSGGPVTAITQ